MKKININLNEQDLNNLEINKTANIKCTELLKELKSSVSTMESCTSGLIASMITDTEGASNVIKGAFVTYCNEAKIMQGVDADIINTYGVYSHETAVSMAKSCMDTYNSEYGIGVTGTTGNVDVNNSDSCPGVIYFSIIERNGEVYSVELRLNTKDKTRHEIKEIIAYYIFDIFYGILNLRYQKNK